MIAIAVFAAKSQWLIQYNKDWNWKTVAPKIEKASQWLIQYNKDWNSFNEARQIAGSVDKLDRVLKGGETLESIYNEGKDPL